jgi:Na+/melibiose symporter-like transporter
MSLITFYGSLSTVCRDEAQRQRVGAFKSFFETIGYCVAYALVPLFLNSGINIRDLVIYATPLMLTMLVPLFILKEGEKYGEGKDFMVEARVPIGKSLKTALKNKVFIRWLIPNCTAFFGLQMFLAAQNTLISGVMKLGPGIAAILNTCAFAPVPFMLFIYYKMLRKKGVRFSYDLFCCCNT